MEESLHKQKVNLISQVIVKVRNAKLTRLQYASNFILHS